VMKFVRNKLHELSTHFFTAMKFKGMDSFPNCPIIIETKKSQAEPHL
ncbi:MAG: hypothetical protein H6Q52_1973, partial [Deltaproteobacteria bacterium]|nr:hypothetical protein [Deltaproteobacteria bacterium]